MRRSFLVLAAMALTTASAFAHGSHSHNRSVSFDDDDVMSASDCGAMRVRFNDERAPVITENVPVGNVRALRVRTDQNGGVRVIGNSGGGYAVTACKAVSMGTDPNQVRVNVSVDEITASGPDNGDWIVYFIVQTPRNATLDVHSSNGPISVYQFDGTLTARAHNGPLGIKNSSGTIDASTQNGPISIDGGSGNVKLSATNGPLAVKLDGSAWNGSLDAATQNGPLALRLPRGFRSGVVVESNGHGPVSCHAEGCYQSMRSRSTSSNDDDWDNTPRRIELGTGTANVHLSTVNGPISIKDRD